MAKFISIPGNEIQWLTWGDDNNGRTFVYKDRLFRAILWKSADLFHFLFEAGILRTLMEKGLVVETRMTDHVVDGYAMVVEHERLPFVSYPYEWSFSMLKDAGLLVVEIAKILDSWNLSLADTHPWNILFDGTKPIWVDIGSIIGRANQAGRAVRSEFDSHYTAPLRLQHNQHLLRVIKRLQQDELSGISPEEYYSLSKGMFPCGLKEHVMYSFLKKYNHRVNGFPMKGLHRFTRHMPFILYGENDEDTSGLMECRIRNINIKLHDSQWGSYRDNDEEMQLEVLERQKIRGIQISEAIKRYRPKALIDLAGNVGHYSIMASALGVKKVICVDYDLTAIEKLYEKLKSLKYNILPLTFNVMAPPGGLDSTCARFKCDMAIALAVTHHLSLTQRISFDFIAKTFAGYTNKYLLVEFMPFGLGIGENSPNLPEWYTLDNFKAALERYFKTIEVRFTNIECNNRTLLICEK